VNPFSGLNENQLTLLEDVFNEVHEDIRHYEDAGFGWDAAAIAEFLKLYGAFRKAAHTAGCWWAR